MLAHLEAKNIICLNDIETFEIQKYYLNLKNRTNKRSGGGLSNSYLNKHQQAIKKFIAYLRKSGKQKLLHVDFRGETVRNSLIDVLTVQQIKALLKNEKNEALFISVINQRMHGQSMLVRLKSLQERSDDLELKQKHLTLHNLRHSIASHLLSAGMDLEKIARFLEHSSLESTQIYTHLITPK
jgi:site-specific recombinase XerD